MARFFWIGLALLVVLRYVSTRPVYQDGDKIRISARITSEPIRYATAQSLHFEGLKIYLPLFPEVGYGDRVVIEGVVGGDKLASPQLLEIKETDNFLINSRKKILSFYKHSLPEPHASLIAGVALGSKQSLPTDFWQALQKTGTAHVVVASGMNVTLVGGFLINLWVNLVPRKKAIIFALIGVWIYIFIAGFEAPLVRAGIMGSLAFSAQALGRVYQAMRALVLSALLMLVAVPGWLFDLGFVLSFVATGSILLFNVKVDRLIHFVPNILRQDLATTLAAQIGVAPILYLTFGQFNLLSPLINALVLWTIPPLTIIGLMAGIVRIPFLFYLTYPLTSWFVWVINIF
jgi:competence protein ComEC